MEEINIVIEKIEDIIFKVKTGLITAELKYIEEGLGFKKISAKVDLIEFPEEMNPDFHMIAARELFQLLIVLEEDDKREFSYHHLIEGNTLSLAIELKRKKSV